mmetsp:Transcript_29032/g.28706  ORF Transcript_29032/g.28706 Transcript_29032/m.28706 type:complete len:150 (+) Transcript_29032:2-451(+)
MKYREFIEDPTYSSNLPEWIDMTFGKKQQKKECTNIFFQFATSEYYEKATIKNLEENTALSSATDFYQLPKCIFAKEHRIIQQKEPNEALMEEPHTETNQETSKNDELKIRANGKIFTKKVEKFDKNRKDQIAPNFEVIAGNVREETSS